MQTTLPLSLITNMTIGSVLLGLALLVLVLLFLARPFMAPTSRSRRMTRRQSLLTQKEVLLDQIRSLDFDLETGKLPEGIHQRQREHLLAEASAILQQIDLLESHATAEADVRGIDDVDAEMEALIARFRQAPPSARPANGHGSFCTQCGQPADPNDRFCAHCGHKLHAKQSV